DPVVVARRWQTRVAAARGGADRGARDEDRARAAGAARMSAAPAEQLRQQVLAGLARTPFRPAFWAKPAFVQLALQSCGRRRTPELRTETWPTPDGDRLELHVLGGDRSRPVVLLLHGLEGSRESRYVGDVACEVVQRGWQLVVLEF